MGNIFSKKKEATNKFEKILSDLDGKIHRVEAHLSQLRNDERRFTLIVVFYSIVIYLVIVLYIFMYPRHNSKIYQPAIDGLLLIGYPVMAYLVKRLINIVFKMRIGKNEELVKNLRVQQKQKLEELKQMTNFYHTKGLIERFDHGTDSLTLARENESVPELERISLSADTGPMTTNMTGSQGGNGHNYQLTNVPHSPATPTWLDRLVDALIGEDRGTKYALICQRCFAHNGLVRPEEFGTINYTCPNCHFFNIPRDLFGQFLGNLPNLGETLQEKEDGGDKDLKMGEKEDNVETPKLRKVAAGEEKNSKLTVKGSKQQKSPSKLSKEQKKE